MRNWMTHPFSNKLLKLLTSTWTNILTIELVMLELKVTFPNQKCWFFFLTQILLFWHNLGCKWHKYNTSLFSSLGGEKLKFMDDTLKHQLKTPLVLPCEFWNKKQLCNKGQYKQSAQCLVPLQWREANCVDRRVTLLWRAVVKDH